MAAAQRMSGTARDRSIQSCRRPSSTVLAVSPVLVVVIVLVQVRAAAIVTLMDVHSDSSCNISSDSSIASTALWSTGSAFLAPGSKPLNSRTHASAFIDVAYVN